MKRSIVLWVLAFALSFNAMAQSALPAASGEGRTVFALKTNALYDAATILNYSLEVPVGNHLSLVWDHYFPWWHWGNRLSIEYLTLGGEARVYFAPRQGRLTGHFLGAYGLWGKGDLQVGTVGCYQVYGMMSAGLRYGYVFRLSKGWNLELSAAAGYLRADYQQYAPASDWSVLWKNPENAGILSYWGPTQLSVTFVKPLRTKPRP